MSLPYSSLSRTLRKRNYFTESVMPSLKYAKASFGKPTSINHSDNSNNYFSRAFCTSVQMTGTFTCTTIPYNLKNNGIAEHIGCTLMNGTRCVISTSNPLNEYCPHALHDVDFKQSLLLYQSTSL